MRISIDSTEPLEDVIRVVGALYNVTLTVAPENESAQEAAVKTSSGGGQRAARRRTTNANRSRRRRSTPRSAQVSNAEVRTWARDNGYTVSDRGRIPAAVAAAYHEAQGR